jgi:hypothetical protein
MSDLVQPHLMDADAWLPTLAQGRAVVPAYRPGEDWRGYARQLEAANAGDFDVPSHEDFDTFQDWADVFYRNNA